MSRASHTRNPARNYSLSIPPAPRTLSNASRSSSNRDQDPSDLRRSPLSSRHAPLHPPPSPPPRHAPLYRPPLPLPRHAPFRLSSRDPDRISNSDNDSLESASSILQTENPSDVRRFSYSSWELDRKSGLWLAKKKSGFVGNDVSLLFICCTGFMLTLLICQKMILPTSTSTWLLTPKRSQAISFLITFWRRGALF